MKKYINNFIWSDKASNTDHRRGVSIFLAMMMLTLIFSLALGLNTLLVSQVKTMRDSGNSVIAFYAADSGIEWASWQWNLDLLNEDNYSGLDYPGYLDLNNNGILDAAADATYDVTAVGPGEGLCPSEANFCAKSIGNYKGTRRVILLRL